jgi:hypothetical protein
MAFGAMASTWLADFRIDIDGDHLRALLDEQPASNSPLTARGSGNDGFRTD